MPNSEPKGVKTKQRLTYIDPNTFAGYFNSKSNPYINTEELSWNPEDLAMSVDLQVIIPRRGDKGQTNYFINLDDVVRKTPNNSAIARYVSYMGGVPLNNKEDSESYLTDNYTNISFQEIRDGQVIDSESLGIDSIDINFDAHFFPIITIKFTDVRGASLFMPSEYEFEQSLKGGSSPGSFFKALFHFPYPRFLLSVKGFYGNRVTFQLAVSDFRSEFQSDSGNYDITVQFIGYVYGLYTDLPLNLVMASPFYNASYWEARQNDGTFRYMSKDGGTGGKIKTYLQFLTELDNRNVTSEALESASNLRDYATLNKEKEFLGKIITCHKNMIDSGVGDDGYVAHRDSNEHRFFWGNKANGFKFNKEIAKEYYNALHDFFAYFTNNESEEVQRVIDGNIFLDNFWEKKTELTTVADRIGFIRNENNLAADGVLDTFRQVTYGENEIGRFFTLTGATYIKTILIDNFENDEELIKYFEDYKFDESPGADNTNLQEIPQIGNNNPLSKCTTVLNINTQYVPINGCLLINKQSYIDKLTSRIEEIDRIKEGMIEVISDEMISVFEEAVGFAPTVENFYRMLFVHIDCFMDFFNKQILGEIDRQTKRGKRKFGWFNNGGGDKIKLNELDIPKTLTGGSDQTAAGLHIYPFPGYYVKKSNNGVTRLTAEYPGRSKNERFRSIEEVKDINKILAGVNYLSQQLRQLANNTENTSTAFNDENVFSVLSVLYNGDNPWNSLVSTLTYTSKQDEVYKIIYFYMCLLCADKAVGTNTGEEYRTRVAKLLADALKSSPSFPTGNEFTDVITEIQAAIENNGLNTLFKEDGSYKFTGGKLNHFKTDNTTISIDNSGEGNDTNNYIPLKIIGDKLNTPPYGGDNGGWVNDANNKYWRFNIKPRGVDRYVSITGENNPSPDSIGVNMLQGAFTDEASCKKLNDKLVSFNEGKKYLDNLREIKYGKYNVSIPRVPDAIHHSVDPSGNFNNNQVVVGGYFNGQMHLNHLSYCSINTSEHNFKRVVYTGDGGTYSEHRITQNFSVNSKISEITTDIKNHYDNGTNPTYPVNFVGRKIGGYDLDDNYIIDKKPAVNLFSGIKTYCVDVTNMDNAYMVKDGQIPNAKPSGVSQDVWNSFNDSKSEYLPLIETDYCKTDRLTNPDSDDSKRALATYLCAVLSGYDGLKNITANASLIDLNNPDNKFNHLSKPCRLVNVLYLGGVLYFRKNYSDSYKFRYKVTCPELINKDGELKNGLLPIQLPQGSTETSIFNQIQDEIRRGETVNLAEFLYMEGIPEEIQIRKEKICKIFINRFETWFRNEFLNKYEKLCKVSTSEEAGYEDLVGFCGQNIYLYRRLVYVQGYQNSGDCSTWLTNLTYAYTHLLGVKYQSNQNVSVTQREITDFLNKLKTNLTINNDNNNGESSEDREKREIDIKTALYYTLKNLYDKWLCTYTSDEFKLKTPEQDIKMRKDRFCDANLNGTKTGSVNIKGLKARTSEYNNFVYVDQFYNDISSTYIMNPDGLSTYVKDIFNGNQNVDVYTFMAAMAEKNNLMLMALPVFNNMYNAPSIVSVFSPNMLYNVNNYDGANGVGTTYVVMYASDVSHQPSLYEGYEYNRDYVDIAGLIDDYGPTDIEFFNKAPNGSKSLNYSVSAFAVTYGKQNQMYFKKINVSMDNPKMTDESIRNTLMLSEAASQGPTEQPMTIGNNLYSIYANRSYTCTVEMLGCANITPLMYFQLNNIPMFRGLYMIINVKHTIKAGDMTTIFTGVRVSRYSLPDVSDILIHSALFKNVMNALQNNTNASSSGIGGSSSSSSSGGSSGSKCPDNHYSCTRDDGSSGCCIKRLKPNNQEKTLSNANKRTIGTGASQTAVYINSKVAENGDGKLIGRNRTPDQIKYIILHYTAGASSSPGKADNHYNMWGATSAEFSVDDKYIVQYIRDYKHKASKAVKGDKPGSNVQNFNSISIEICNSLKGETVYMSNTPMVTFTTEALENVAKLIKALCSEIDGLKNALRNNGGHYSRNIIKRHFDAQEDNKACPGVPGWTPREMYSAKQTTWNNKNVEKAVVGGTSDETAYDKFIAYLNGNATPGDVIAAQDACAARINPQ